MDLKRKCNVKTFYFSIKTTIAIVSLLIVSWFYFSKHTFRLSGIKYYKCNSLAWRHFDESFSLISGFDIYNSNYVNNYMKKYSSWNLPDQEVRKYILQGCNLARDDRRTLITIFSVLSATIFLSIPKPKASSEPKRVGSAPVGTGPDRTPSEPDPSRGGAIQAQCERKTLPKGKACSGLMPLPPSRGKTARIRLTASAVEAVESRRDREPRHERVSRDRPRCGRVT